MFKKRKELEEQVTGLSRRVTSLDIKLKELHKEYSLMLKVVKDGNYDRQYVIYCLTVDHSVMYYVTKEITIYPAKDYEHMYRNALTFSDYDVALSTLRMIQSKVPHTENLRVHRKSIL